jgi:formylmethanofuran dehydrogenase subunit E
MMTLPNQELFRKVLYTSAKQHQNLCPRQVLGIRMGLYGMTVLGIKLDAEPYDNKRKRLFVFVETDGCAADGISAATACTVGHRTLRVEDYGKLAVTLADTVTKEAVRVRPNPEARQLAQAYPMEAKSRWHRYLSAYRLLSDEQLLEAVPIQLTVCLEAIISSAQKRAVCEQCSEEIMNGREVSDNGRTFCRSCAGMSYYGPLHHSAQEGDRSGGISRVPTVSPRTRWE